jgi:UDP-3-O-[3-hydroxymyristoyl] glucosamine N-acyltransferase
MSMVAVSEQHTVREVAECLTRLGASVVNDTAVNVMREVTGFAHQRRARSGCIAWLRRPLPCEASIVVVGGRIAPQVEACGAIVAVHDDPRTLLARLIRELYLVDARRCARVDLFGSDTSVHPAAELGVGGMNYVGDDPFPSLGGVEVRGGARIDAFATVARGTVTTTSIGAGARIGAHVNIGHDCQLGAGTMVVTHASLAGWVEVGAGARIYQGALVKNGVRIGERATVGMGAVVLRDVPPGETWAGNPARRIG